MNAIHPTFIIELGYWVRPTNLEAEKIDNTTLNIYEIVVTAFSMSNKANQVRFLEKIFLMANFGPKIALGISFLSLNKAGTDFLD